MPSETVAVPERPSFDLILAAETKRMPLASKMVKIADAAMETTATMAKAAQLTLYQAALWRCWQSAFPDQRPDLGSGRRHDPRGNIRATQLRVAAVLALVGTPDHRH